MTKDASITLKQSDIDKIPKRDKNVVFGFARQAQKILRHNIPPLIIHVILSFFHVIEIFDKSACSDNILVNDECNEIQTKEKLKQHTGTVYGSVAIDGQIKCKYIWIFKIIIHKNIIGIGIDASNKAHTNQVFYDKRYNNGEFYASQILTDFTTKHCQARQGMLWRDLKGQIQSGDLIKMELDVNKKTLRYFVKDQDQGIAFDNIDFNNGNIYHMAVYLMQHQTKIKLERFEIYE